MEGKAILFKEFANVDAFPICLDTKNADEIVINGAGAAGTSIAKLLLSSGVKNLIACDKVGILYKGIEGVDDAKEAGVAIIGTGRSDYPNQLTMFWFSLEYLEVLLTFELRK